MDKPDQRLFVADLASAEFRAGALKGYWGLAGTEVLADQPDWPAAGSLGSISRSASGSTRPLFSAS